MTITEFETRGFYEPGFLHLRINTDKSLKNLNELIVDDRPLFSTFLHEYIHFLQEISTTTGLTNAAFYINTIKDVNQTVINDGKADFEVPFKFNNEYNTLTQIELKRIYIGESTEVAYAKYDGFIEEEKEVIDRDNNILKVKRYKVFYYDTIRNCKNFYFGITCIKEFIAHTIQTKFCPEIAHPDIPYVIVELILDKECPSLAKNIDTYLAICDACLMSYHPAQLFFNTVTRIKKDCFEPKSAQEMYDYVLNLKFNGNDKIYTPSELFKEAKEIVINHFENALQAEIFSANLKWIKHILEEAFLIRETNPTYINQILDENGNLSKTFFSLFDKLGTPYFTNSLNEGGLIPPKNIEENPHQPYQLLVFKEILNIFNGQQNCSLINMCNKTNSMVVTNELCNTSPWKRAKDEQLCPFAQMWRTWALTNENPVKKH